MIARCSSCSYLAKLIFIVVIQIRKLTARICAQFLGCLGKPRLNFNLQQNGTLSLVDFGLVHSHRYIKWCVLVIQFIRMRERMRLIAKILVFFLVVFAIPGKHYFPIAIHHSHRADRAVKNPVLT